MKKFLSLIFVLCLMLSAAACARPASTPAPADLTEAEQILLTSVTASFMEAFLAEDYEACTVHFNKDMRAALSAGKLKDAWEATAKLSGTIEEPAATTYAADTSYLYALTTLNCVNRGVLTRLTVTREGEIAGLFFSYTDKINETIVLPDGVTEEEITVGEGTSFPLKGRLTLPEGATAPLTAIVLVHGSGPQDMDESIYANKPFRDIAYALAQEGFAVLRYNKRTYSHGAAALADGTAFTVSQESIDDALLAKALLAADARIDPANIYIAGHSLGGMLTPRIVSEGDFAGGIMLAGSPRRLVDIIYMQNEAVIATLTGQEKTDAQKLVDDEMQKYDVLLAANDEDALKSTQAFGTAAYYYAEMDSHPPEDYLRQSAKPFLALHGTSDFQVDYEQDYKLYEAMILPNLECKAFEGLNHLFMPSTMETPDITEYEIPAQVAPQVTAYIAAWLRREAVN